MLSNLMALGEGLDGSGPPFIRVIIPPVPAPFLQEEERQDPYKILCMDLTSEPVSPSVEHEPQFRW